MTRIFSLLRRYMHCIHLSSTRLLPDYVHPVWWWSSCRSSLIRLCSPRLTVEFMSLIFYQTLFTPFDGGVHVAHLLPDSVHPIWWWSSCRSSFSRLCSPRLTVWSSCRSSFTRLCSPRLTVEFMSLIFYQTLFTPFDDVVHVAHLLPDSVHPVWRWSSCRSSFTRLCSPSLTVEFMSLIFSVFCVMCFNIYVFPVFCFVCWLMSFAFPFGRLLGVR